MLLKNNNLAMYTKSLKKLGYLDNSKCGVSNVIVWIKIGYIFYLDSKNLILPHSIFELLSNI